MIKVINLNKGYGDVMVLTNISVDFENGKIYALVGRNGVGKTSMLNAISSHILKDRGDVIIDGVCHEEFETKYKLFYVSDNKNSFLNYTIREYLGFVMKVYKKNNKASSMNYFIQKLQLEGDIDKYIGECSFGTKQKAYLAGAFVSESNNLILDEPFNGLDPHISSVLRYLLKSLTKQGKMVLFSTHNLDVVSNFSDVVLFLNDKSINCYDKSDNTYENIYKKFEEYCWGS